MICFKLILSIGKDRYFVYGIQMSVDVNSIHILVLRLSCWVLVAVKWANIGKGKLLMINQKTRHNFDEGYVWQDSLSSVHLLL